MEVKEWMIKGSACVTEGIWEMEWSLAVMDNPISASIHHEGLLF